MTISLPYTIGDTVYFHSYYSKGILQGKIKAITIDDKGVILTILYGGQITKRELDKVFMTKEEADKQRGI